MPKVTLEQRYTQALLLEAMQEIFDTMVFLDIHPVPVEIPQVIENAVLGMITFTGDGVEGGFCFRTSNACGIAITAQMLGDETTNVYSTDDVDDTIREICNMTMGCIKTIATGRLGNVQMSIPSVTRGIEIEQSLGDDLQSVSLMVSVGNTFPAELSLLWREAHV